MGTTHEDKYVVSIAAPGVAPADLTIEVVEGPRLAVRGRTVTNAHTHFVNYTVALAPDADGSNATAESADGVITVTVPKRPLAVKMIPVGTADADTTPDESDDDAAPYAFTVVAAGFAAAEIEISAEGGVLKVRGESKRTGAQIARSFRLPRDANPNDARATHIDGILTVTVPKKPPPEPRRIAVGPVPLRVANDLDEDEKVALADEGMMV